ncbi:hypothetical protein K461DRAFT_293226 [Myriangium duriaei CBS 260.36]|uniref:Fucose-specific lectin n=1 Tax=Myriangium duriaei CBS 260.36 TaxID=1168546 RepID=A0A9P4J2I9_9PEZI|nr:hypothetical protein K461DRAFT_293226 [Myriangium duriaei CBS 260.36]
MSAPTYGTDAQTKSPISESGTLVHGHSTKEAVDSKSHPIDDGLMPVEQDHMKEVVRPDHSAPQVVEYAPYYAPNSAVQQPQEQQHGYYPPSGDAEGARAGAPPQKSRNRKWLIIGGVILLLVIIAAVLGGVLGTQLNKKHNDSSSTSSSSPSGTGPVTGFAQGVNNSGIATASLTDGQGMLMYYQAPNNSIIEAYLPNGVLTASNTDRDYSKSKAIVPILDIAQGSPLTALTYTVNNTQYKQLFYANSQYRIMQINAPGMNAAWGAPTQVSPPSSTQILNNGSTGLDACISTTGSLKGVRLYYSSAAGYIQELSWNFGDRDVTNMWIQQYPFKGSDPKAGVACTLHQNGDGTTTVDVYMRNSTTKDVAHWYYIYVNQNLGGSWQKVTEDALHNDDAYNFADGAPITATLDSTNANQYIFYGGYDGVKMASGTVAKNGSANSRVSTNVGSWTFPQLATYYINSAPLIFRQYPSGGFRVVSLASDGTQSNNNTIYR